MRLPNHALASRSAGTLGVALALLAAISPPATARADTVLAVSHCEPADTALATVAAHACTRVSAHDGRVLWSTYDIAAGHYVLMTAYRGVVAPVPVAPRARHFDADLGEDDRGNVVATYSRCAGDPGGPAAGCVARELRFEPGASEHALLPGVTDAEPLLPTRWHRRVAVARRVLKGPRHAYLCSTTGAPRCRTMPGGRGGDSPLRAGPIAIDIDARHIATAWFGNEQGDTRHHAILVSTFEAKNATTIVEVGAGYAGNESVHSPVLDGGYVYFARGGASCDYWAAPDTAGRFDLARHTIEEVTTPPLAALAVDAGRVTYASCDARRVSGLIPAAAVTATDPSPFDRPGALRVRGAERCPAARRSATWSTQTLAKPGRSPQSTGLVSGPDGSSMALWSSHGKLAYASRGRRGTFGRVRSLSSGARGAIPASDDAGHLAVAWVDGIGDGSAIRASAGTVGGRLSHPQTLAADPTSIDAFPSLHTAMAPDGGAVVAWTQRGTGGASPTLFVSFRPPGATRFGAPVRLALPTPYYPVVALAAGSGGRVLVVVSAFDRVGVIEGTAAGLTGPRTLTAPGDLGIGGEAVLGAGGAATVVLRGPGALNVLTRAAGGDFAAAKQISTPAQPVGAPSLDMHASRVTLAWSERDVRGTLARVKVASGRVGEPLSAPRPQPTLRGTIDEVRVAVGVRGAATVVWRAGCGPAGGRIVAITRPGGSAGFGRAKLVSGGDRHVLLPVVALGRAGRPIVSWVAASRPQGRSRVRVAVAGR